MIEYKITFQVIKNQKTINYKSYNVKKSKYELIRRYAKTLIKGISKKQYPKYNKK